MPPKIKRFVKLDLPAPKRSSRAASATNEKHQQQGESSSMPRSRMPLHLHVVQQSSIPTTETDAYKKKTSLVGMNQQGRQLVTSHFR